MNDRTVTIVGGVVCVGIIALIIVVAILKRQEKYISPEPTYPLPPGNYQKTCKHANMVGTTLEAKCLLSSPPGSGEDVAIYIPSSLEGANTCPYVVNSSYMAPSVYTGTLSCSPYIPF